MGFNSLNNASRTRKNLVNRILLTLGIIFFARLGTFIPIPGIDQNYLYRELQNSPILNFFSSFSQGDFFVLGPFTLGILPNINASITMQLLTSISPALQRLQKDEGLTGQKKSDAIHSICYGSNCFYLWFNHIRFFKTVRFWLEFYSSIENCRYFNNGCSNYFMAK
jgi:preprotein translocase subunit SecY